MKKTTFLLSVATLLIVGCKQPAKNNNSSKKQDSDIKTNPLPSWSKSSKKAIIDFVNEVVSTPVPIEQRIATFDQDGTLWCEQPRAVQREFAYYQNEKTQKVKIDTLRLSNDKRYRDSINLTVSLVSEHGMKLEEYNADVKYFLENARHERFNRKYTELIYKPMLELIEYLRKNEFKIYICSGGGNDFMRVFANEIYKVAPENVIGSFSIAKFDPATSGIVKNVNRKCFVNCAKDGKPISIQQRLGRIPIFSAGNVLSAGDVEHLAYCQSNSLPNFQLLINHDDSIHEYAYGENDKKSIPAAEENGWFILNIKKDWKKVFPWSEIKNDVD